MFESAALLVDEVLPEEPIRQWVLSVPFPLRFLFAAEPAAMGRVLAIVYRAMASQLIRKAGLTRATGQTGAVTLIQRFGSALNLNIHFHILCLDGAYTLESGQPRFRDEPVVAAVGRTADPVWQHRADQPCDPGRRPSARAGRSHRCCGRRPARQPSGRGRNSNSSRRWKVAATGIRDSKRRV